MNPRDLAALERFARRVERAQSFDDVTLSPENAARLYDARLCRALALRYARLYDARLLDKVIVGSYRVMKAIGAERVAARSIAAWREEGEHSNA